MHIIWKGQTSFNILLSQNKGEQITIAVDPYDATTETKLSRSKSDIILSTQIVEKKNLLTGKDDTAYIIDGPGEYDIKDVYIKGVFCPVSISKNKDGASNTIFTIEAEEMNICHLGLFNQKELTNRQIEEIGNVDVLLIPVGDSGFCIDGNEAASIVNQIDPRIVIPMFSKIPGVNLKLDSADKFFKAMGESPELQDKLLIKKKDLPREDEISVIALKP